MAIRKTRSQMVMSSAEIAAVYASWGKEEVVSEAEQPAETLEQIADRVAPQGGPLAALRAAKARAKRAAYAASRPPPEPAEPTQEQQAAFAEYVAAREEWEGLRDDIAFANSFAKQDDAAAKLRAATARYHIARKEAERLKILEVARRLFR